MPGATSKMTKSAKDVVPEQNFYNYHFFAFTNACNNACADGQFGVKGISTTGTGFLPSASESRLPKAIVSSIGPLLDEFDVDKYLQINYEASEIQAAVMRANMPLARVVIFVPPCLQAVATAVAVCEAEETEVIGWSVRVDSHRLGCACCEDTASALKRIEMIADTIADVESGNHRATLDTPETGWIKHIDSAWMENILYHKDDVEKYLTSKEEQRIHQDYAGLREMLTHNDRQRFKIMAVILADVDNASWIINSRSFPTVERQPRVSEMYCVKKEVPGFGGKYVRTFEGIFATKNALKRRREESPSPPALAQTTRKRNRAIK